MNYKDLILELLEIADERKLKLIYQYAKAISNNDLNLLDSSKME